MLAEPILRRRRPPALRLLGLALALLAAAAVVVVLLDSRDSGGSSVTVPLGPAGDAFYRPPSPLPPARPGDLIWARQAQAQPAGVRAWQVLYHSTGVSGRDVAVSGMVYYPRRSGRARAVIAWAHGTSGLGDQCAPSRSGETPPYVEELVARRSYVVAATDYEGLGTPGPHPFLVGRSEALSVLDIVRAASRLVGADASPRVIIGGHSQGGAAALFAGELARAYAPELHLAGVISIAPAAELRFLSGVVSHRRDYGYVLMALYGFRAANPSLPLDRVLTPRGIADLRGIAGRCVGAVLEDYAARAPATVLRADPATVPPWSAELDRNSPGQAATPAPILLLHGDADGQVPLEVSQRVLERVCRLRHSAERRVYAGADHQSVVDDATDDVLRWIDDRVHGKQVADGCRPS